MKFLKLLANVEAQKTMQSTATSQIFQMFLEPIVLSPLIKPTTTTIQSLVWPFKIAYLTYIF